MSTWWNTRPGTEIIRAEHERLVTRFQLEQATRLSSETTGMPTLNLSSLRHRLAGLIHRAQRHLLASV